MLLTVEILPPCDPGMPPERRGATPAVLLFPSRGEGAALSRGRWGLRSCEVELSPEVAVRPELLLKSRRANA
jgi:hypothetical protein